MKNFFQRPKSNEYRTSFVPMISAKMNISNLDHITKQQVLNLYNKKDENDFLAYRFDMLKTWMNNNYEYSKSYVASLEDMINKLYLTNELNSFEQQYIKNFQAIVFAKNRNLKQLIVDFPIEKNEFVFYRYNLITFKQINQTNVVRIIKQPEIYITTRRIIISNKLDIISMYFTSINNFQYLKNQILIDLIGGISCFITSNNNQEIIESIKRILKKRKFN